MNLKEFLLASNGKIFTVCFTKRTTRERRIMTCRTGVTCKLTGGVPAYDPNRFNLLWVYDMTKRAYRSIPLDAIHWIKMDGQEITITQDNTDI